MKGLLILAWILCGALQAAEGLVFIVNTATRERTVGVLVDKEKRLFLTSHRRQKSDVFSGSVLVGGKMDVAGPQGRYGAKIITEDPLYGLCVVQADHLKAVDGVQEVRLSSQMVPQGYAAYLIEPSFYLYQCDTQCAVVADVSWHAHYAQNVMLYAGVGQYTDGTVLLNDAGAVCSLWQGDGWVPPESVRHIVDKARNHVRNNTCDLGKVWCFAENTFGYEQKYLCQKFLGDYPHKDGKVLVVMEVGEGSSFHPGDVLLRIQDVCVEGDFDALMATLRTTTESSVECAIVRYGEKMTLQVPLTLLEEKWLPYFSLRDCFFFSVNQRFHYASGLPEGSLVCAWERASSYAWRLNSVNGKPMTYADFESLAAREKPSYGCVKVSVSSHNVSGETRNKSLPAASWVVRRIDPLS